MVGVVLVIVLAGIAAGRWGRILPAPGRQRVCLLSVVFVPDPVGYPLMKTTERKPMGYKNP